ncbi:D-2-hydroxyacid dehydrogenase [Daejeonella lutea]|uniref:Glycerate dehydrogenase n=1 Tax=Daejeonella lutea TaxID=572036 RepID=A0A1T5DWH6_9SPHI|nr:D-2-hydroxyacid dehydrogenase [Daejeonella lutea]SKB76148.1 glycerate dehydrogenase [Daejeonella lutea]
MKIVVLDGYTLNPGDLSWIGLKMLGHLTVYDRTPANLILERCEGAEIVFTNKTPLGAEVIHQLSNLQFIGVLATGYNVVDVAAATASQIIVSNVPGYGTASVAQFTIALLLELCHRVQRHSDSVLSGKWSRSPDFSYWDSPLVELQGKTIGIIGFGDIGSKLGDLATAFGMNIIATGRRRTGQGNRKNFAWADLNTLLAESDVVSLHCPLYPETQGLINADRLQRMKHSAFLLNTSRGPLVVEEDLAIALNTGQIAGAAIDVLSTEPPSLGNPLFTAKNCIITPHIAWATREARERLMGIAVENLSAFIKGTPINIVKS